MPRLSLPLPSELSCCAALNSSTALTITLLRFFTLAVSLANVSVASICGQSHRTFSHCKLVNAGSRGYHIPSFIWTSRLATKFCRTVGQDWHVKEENIHLL